MNTRLMDSLRLAVAAVLVAVTVPVVVLAGPDEGQTEDILYMADGRELHGQILREDTREVVFQLVDKALGLKTSMTFPLSAIARIDRDVPVAAEPVTDVHRARGPASRPADEEPTERFGRARPTNDNLDLPTLYVVPMRGQMGTDIHKSIYEEVVEDIKQLEPDVVIFELDSKDFPDLMIPQVEDPRDSRGFLMFEEYRELVNMFQDELADTRQVMWVKDSVGFSSLIALSWGELYMTPEARLAGLRSVIDTTGADKWSDPDVRAKMSAAIGAFVKAHLEYGGYDMELADAMLWPETLLSATFKGREVVWWPNLEGEIILDDDEESTGWFRSKVAEDLLVSDGTVENIDDLAFLLGYREYREVGEHGQGLVEDYVERWKKVFEQSREWYLDYEQHQGWAGGDETLQWLGRAKRDLEQIIKAMERYRAVEIRWQRDFGVTKFALEIQVEQMKEQIRALKQGRGATRGGGAGGGGLGGG
ncbi:MAG: Clp protease/crotonase-like domain-containing protein [Planctomycetota bacterium]